MGRKKSPVIMELRIHTEPYDGDRSVHTELVLERAIKVLEDNGFYVGSGSAEVEDDRDQRMRLDEHARVGRMRHYIAEKVAQQGQGLSQGVLYDLVMDVPVSAAYVDGY